MMISKLQEWLKKRVNAAPVKVRFVGDEHPQRYVMVDVDAVGVALASSDLNSWEAIPWAMIESIWPDR